jgi:hypothetical protein
MECSQLFLPQIKNLNLTREQLQSGSNELLLLVGP